MPELLAAVGLASAEALPANIDRKIRIHDMYAEGFAGSGLTLQQQHPLDKPVWWLNSVVLPKDVGFTAEELGHSIMENYPDIEVRPAFFPLHTMAPFKAGAQPCPNAEEVYRRLFCLPSSAQLSDDNIKYIVSSVLEQVKKKSS
jgi:dTDP-4-amino-4,6-dideoxygalactose transaminase